MVPVHCNTEPEVHIVMLVADKSEQGEHTEEPEVGEHTEEQQEPEAGEYTEEQPEPDMLVQLMEELGMLQQVQR